MEGLEETEKKDDYLFGLLEFLILLFFPMVSDNDFSKISKY